MQLLKQQRFILIALIADSLAYGQHQPKIGALKQNKGNSSFSESIVAPLTNTTSISNLAGQVVTWGTSSTPQGESTAVAINGEQ